MAPIRRPRVVNGPLVKPREPGRLSDLARMTLLGLVLALPAFLYAGMQATLHDYRREVVGLEQQSTDLDEQRRRLDVEYATLAAPQRIAALAREVSGLVAPEQEQIVFLLRTPDAPVRDPQYVAEATGGRDGRQRR